MLPLLFARRYLFSPHSRSVVNLIAGVSVTAVAMPVAAMIVLLSVFNGFEGLIRSMYSTFDAPLTVTPREGVLFPADGIDTAALHRIPGITGYSFVLEQSVLLRHGDRRAIATLRGVDDAYSELFPLDEAVCTGSPEVRRGDLDYLLPGQALALELGIRSLADADIDLYALRRGNFSSLLPVGNFTRLTVPVGGLFSLDTESERQLVLCPLRLVRELAGHPDRASALLVDLAPGADPERVRTAVAESLGGDFRLRTREELRASFYRIMNYEKWGIFFIALLVLIVASFSVVGALAMLVTEKRRDIATLRALGASTARIRSLFRAEGHLICALGAAAGLLLGIGAVLLQQHLGLIEIPARTFLTQSYPVQLRGGDLCAVLLSFALVAWLLARLTTHGMIKNNDRS